MGVFCHGEIQGSCFSQADIAREDLATSIIKVHLIDYDGIHAWLRNPDRRPPYEMDHRRGADCDSLLTLQEVCVDEQYINSKDEDLEILNVVRADSTQEIYTCEAIPKYNQPLLERNCRSEHRSSSSSPISTPQPFIHLHSPPGSSDKSNDSNRDDCLARNKAVSQIRGVNGKRGGGRVDQEEE